MTESSGRIHTSTATVAVLPEAEDVDIDIRQEDLKIDTYRASGAGGQHVNMTDSAVRITHLPTGLVVTCQDERSRSRTRVKDMNFLKAKLYDMELREQQAKVAAERKGQVGTGDRFGEDTHLQLPPEPVDRPPYRTDTIQVGKHARGGSPGDDLRPDHGRSVGEDEIPGRLSLEPSGGPQTRLGQTS